jgi:uncharacterized protein
MPFDPISMLAEELSLPAKGIEAVCGLLDDGGTVPFIARYRKEATGGLDEVQIRAIQERRAYLEELEQRRQAILSSIDEQGKLTDELRAQIEACATKSALEDLYLPYKKKRRTRATIARERGLEPLATRILAQPDDGDPAREAQALVDPERGVEDAGAALSGARDIVAEVVSESADVRGMLRRALAEGGMLVSQMHPSRKGERTKFEQYYDFQEKAAEIPSHRFLALRRGEREKVLRVSLQGDTERLVARIERKVGLRPSSPFADQLRHAVEDAFGRLLSPSVENDIRAELKQRSDGAAVDVFANNLRNLLLAAPLGAKRVVGIDPGLRTGCKCVAVDDTGKFLETVTVYIGQGASRDEKAAEILAAFIERHRPFAVAVGNGTGGRETEAFTRKLLAERDLTDTILVLVNESGASVYSASELARDEFPDLDVTVRGAISIARRLQDPLAELVKIEPKAIGVGQYQHDVHQPLLQRKLDEVVESCVNQVGVELNTASAPLLARVAGIGPTLARNIVKHREENGPFETRARVLKVPKLGPRTYEQAAGFLRVRRSKHPLDVSAVHPERYKLVEGIAKDLGVELKELVGSAEHADRIDISRYVSGEVGEPTLRDIVDELRKPGRDPRSTFEPPKFKEGVETLEDLAQGMVLEGVVTNVTAFGAFVDVGVHQDGLVHISQLADHFVKDPHDVVQVGDRLTVRVLDVDLERRRISLSARSDAPPRRRGEQHERPERKGGAGAGRAAPSTPKQKRGKPGPQQQREQPRRFTNNPFADLLKKS